MNKPSELFNGMCQRNHTWKSQAENKVRNAEISIRERVERDDEIISHMNDVITPRGRSGRFARSEGRHATNNTFNGIE